MMAVLLFSAAITAAFWYLKFEELNREQELVQRDVEYAQQRLRLRLVERQEALLRMARDLSVDASLEQKQTFKIDAQALLDQTPEIANILWLDAKRRVLATAQNPIIPNALTYRVGSSLQQPEELNSFKLSRDLMQPVYSQPIQFHQADKSTIEVLQLHVPIFLHGQFVGGLVTQYSIDGMLRHAVPQEVLGRYAVSLRDASNNVLAGQSIKRPRVSQVLPWLTQFNEYEVPITPVGYTLSLHAQPYRTGPGLIANGWFWLVAALSGITVWLLVASWRHTRRRVQAQQALLAETSFRRAMENSLLTGMRAMDLQGRITYVNAAFCQMTGWQEEELIGREPPFPYWPDDEREQMQLMLNEELSGRTPTSGFQVRVKRKDRSVFDARLYVSPLVDARGLQTGWMTSMTDITEPNRIRDQLAAAHDRFTTVLEGLDASVSVAPLGSEELVFANKMYRQWFSATTEGHLRLVAQAGRLLESNTRGEATDPLAGFPTDELTEIQSEHAEIYVAELGKWLEVRSRYLNWVDGRLAQMVIATDITSRRQAEELAAHHAERAQSSSRLITMGEMASSVAHELNQPLTAINNYCNGMVSRLKANNLKQDDLLTALEKTAHQAQRAGQIIQRIKSFVKRSEPNRSLADIATIVSEAVELAGIELRRRQVQLTQVVPSDLPKLHVDPILIEQVLINLMKNAAESIDAAKRPYGQRQVELRVRSRREDDQPVIEFVVTDTGLGLPPEVMAHLFEAFYSTKVEGMGIGLNLCRSIVESHQGRMRAENLYNAQQITGCRFSFWLPVRETSVQQQADPAKGDAGVSV
jgi:PAS domain S-box-containing protein